MDGNKKKASALNVQVGGGHYCKLKIQPVEYIHANDIPFIEGCIIKYATRWRDKGGIKDLEKIKHFTDLLIELESKEANAGPTPEEVPEEVPAKSAKSWKPVDLTACEESCKGCAICVSPSKFK